MMPFQPMLNPDHNVMSSEEGYEGMLPPTSRRLAPQTSSQELYRRQREAEIASASRAIQPTVSPVTTTTTITSIEGGTGAKVVLDNGDRVALRDWEKLNLEDQRLLKLLGVDDFNEMVDIKKAEFEATHVLLSNGDYIDRTDYEARSPEEQSLLMSRGVEGFNAWVNDQTVANEFVYQQAVKRNIEQESVYEAGLVRQQTTPSPAPVSNGLEYVTKGTGNQASMVSSMITPNQPKAESVIPYTPTSEIPQLENFINDYFAQRGWIGGVVPGTEITLSRPSEERALMNEYNVHLNEAREAYTQKYGQERTTTELISTAPGRMAELFPTALGLGGAAVGYGALISVPVVKGIFGVRGTEGITASDIATGAVGVAGLAWTGAGYGFDKFLPPKNPPTSGISGLGGTYNPSIVPSETVTGLISPRVPFAFGRGYRPSGARSALGVKTNQVTGVKYSSGTSGPIDTDWDWKGVGGFNYGDMNPPINPATGENPSLGIFGRGGSGGGGVSVAESSTRTMTPDQLAKLMGGESMVSAVGKPIYSPRPSTIVSPFTTPVPSTPSPVVSPTPSTPSFPFVFPSAPSISPREPSIQPVPEPKVPEPVHEPITTPIFNPRTDIMESPNPAISSYPDTGRLVSTVPKSTTRSETITQITNVNDTSVAPFAPPRTYPDVKSPPKVKIPVPWGPISGVEKSSGGGTLSSIMSPGPGFIKEEKKKKKGKKKSIFETLTEAPTNLYLPTLRTDPKEFFAYKGSIKTKKGLTKGRKVSQLVSF